MACEFVIPAKGHGKEKVCGKPEVSDKRCAAHLPKAAVDTVSPPKLTWFLRPEGSGTTVNGKLQTAANDGTGWIENTCQNGAQTGGMPFRGKGGSFSLLHNTQPRTNFTIFYNWTGAIMEVFAAGEHTGTTNTVYSLTWFDGSNATIDLKKKTIV